jgi:hypothetical protein
MSTSPEFLCVLCSKTVDLTTDLNTDESGKTVHEPCYVARLTRKSDPNSDSKLA